MCCPWLSTAVDGHIPSVIHYSTHTTGELAKMHHVVGFQTKKISQKPLEQGALTGDPLNEWVTCSFMNPNKWWRWHQITVYVHSSQVLYHWATSPTPKQEDCSIVLRIKKSIYISQRAWSFLFLCDGLSWGVGQGNVFVCLISWFL